MKYMSDIIIQLYWWCITTNNQEENSCEFYCLLARNLINISGTQNFRILLAHLFICKFKALD